MTVNDSTAQDARAVNLSLSPRAIEQIKLLLQKGQRQGEALRVSVTDGGCSGFSYKLDFDNQQRPTDIVLELDGVNVYVDSASAPYLKGTVIDYVAGLYGGGFKFTNPNATGTCGCGTSFSA
ncbi:MAG TPA: iron-sulfur cluster assembly accessory protein [Candidatus Binatia bacterium]|nr:iron-sulfur cluster assembly accessory protein [Candidatus Binatia bacterium]